MKIIITGPDNIDKLNLSKQLIFKNDEFSITPSFTTDDKYKDEINDNYIYYLNPNIVSLSYKNNAFLFVTTKDYKSTGVTLDDFYNNSILPVNLSEFNLIIDKVFTKNDILVIWLDTKKHDENIKEYIKETRYLEERLHNNNLNIKYLYFLDENKTDIVNIILSYLNGTEEEKTTILQEFC